MKVVFHEDFRIPIRRIRAESGRMEAVERAIHDRVTWVRAIPATEEDIAAVHSDRMWSGSERGAVRRCIPCCRRSISRHHRMTEPCFGLVRPPVTTPRRQVPGLLLIQHMASRWSAPHGDKIGSA
jgi:hypothetical protein